MKLVLYYKQGCLFCRSVLNTIKNLKIQDKVELRDITDNTDLEDELEKECGNTQVPTLFIDGKPMRESQHIKKFFVDTFMQ